jgi:polysaccharide chain length determinant protein (PEP-CTERM system associated)
MAWRRKWHVLVPFVVVAAGAAVIAKRLPDLYSSQATILIVPQRVPENYVAPTVTARVEDRVRTIAQQILSRTQLEKLILEFNLYQKERSTQLMEDVVAKMRDDIAVQVGQQGASRRPDSTSFQIAYVARDARTAVRVTERLASLFIEENLRDREVMAEGTNRFLESQLNDARERLAEQERKVEAYRQKYTGELPTQQQANLQIIATTQLQIQTLNETMERERDRKLTLERMLADLNAPAAADEPAPTDDDSVSPVAAAKETLHEMETRLKPEHPDIVRQKRIIRDLERAATTTPAGTPRPAPPDPRQQRRAALSAEIEALDRTLTAQASDDTRLRDVMKRYQGYIDAIPQRESEMIALTRDYDTLQRVYTTLLAKSEDAKVAANLEKRQIGEQFKLIDPPVMPESPSSPDRVQFDLIGAAIGLGIGCLLAGIAEYRDSSLRTADDVLSAVSIPVLAMIPVMPMPTPRGSRRRRLWGATTAAAVGVIALAATVWAFIR